MDVDVTGADVVMVVVVVRFVDVISLDDVVITSGMLSAGGGGREGSVDGERSSKRTLGSLMASSYDGGG